VRAPAGTMRETLAPAAQHAARGTIADGPAGWDDLATTALEANPLFAPAVTAASLAHLGDASVRIAAPCIGGRLVALAPIRPARLGRIAPAMSVWTNLYAPLGTPLLDAAAPDAAAEALAGEMAGRSARRVLLFPDLPLDGPAATAIRGFAERSGRPAVEIGAYARAALLLRPGAAPLRDTLERRRRKEFARQWRRLAEQGGLSFRRLVDGPDFERAALAFLALEAGGWKGRQGTALAADPKSRAFALAALLGSAPGNATIDELLLGGVPIAMLASFHAGGRAVSWKIAYHERFARFSPGVQLMLEASDAWAAAGNVALVDSLAAAGHPMIDGLWPERIRVGLLALGPPGGSALFSLAVRSAESESALRQKLRALRKRRRSKALREEDVS